MRAVVPWTGLSVLLVVGCAHHERRLDQAAAIRLVEQRLPHVTHQKGFVVDWSRPATLEARMREHGVPGVAVAVIDGFEVVWARGYGVREAGRSEPVTADTLFQVASITKVLTAAGALRLVEAGRIGLDEDVAPRLQGWKLPASPLLAERKVTLRRLLSHTAGIGPADDWLDVDGTGAPTLAQVLSGQPPARNNAAIVERIPGTGHQYSNFGYLIVQQLIRDLTGQSYAEYMQREVLAPVGMTSSTFAERPAGMLRRCAIPHTAKGRPAPPETHPSALANGGLWSTATDMARFLAELMRDIEGRSDRLLSREVAAQMVARQVELDPVKFFGSTGQALGLFLMDDGRETYIAHPGGNTPGYTGILIGLPRTGQGAVVLVNHMVGHLLYLEIVHAVAAAYGWSLGQPDRQQPDRG